MPPCLHTYLHVIEDVVESDDEVADGDEGGHVVTGDVEQHHISQIKKPEDDNDDNDHDDFGDSDEHHIS